MIKTLYAIFIGLLLVTFIGVGVAAFFPQPEHPDYPDDLYRSPAMEEEHIEEDQAAMAEYEAAVADYQEHYEAYSRNVSLILVGFAIMVLIFCLTLFKALPVIADGLLLGGIFTLIYGIGWSFAAGDKRFIFLMVTVGLVVALILGYIKFIRPMKSKAS